MTGALPSALEEPIVIALGSVTAVVICVCLF